MTSARTASSFKNISLGLAGLFLALGLFFAAAPQAHATTPPCTNCEYVNGLTENQVSSILNLLSAFGADQETIDTVSNILRGVQTGCTGTCATFTASPTSGVAPLDVSFITNNVDPLHYSIEYGDGSSASCNSDLCSGSTAWAIVHTYSAAGTYVAKLREPLDGEVVDTKTIRVGAAGTPSCSITYTPSSISYGGSFAAQWGASNATARTYQLVNNATGAVFFGPSRIAISGSITKDNFQDMGPGSYTRTDSVSGPTGSATCSARLVVTQGTPTTTTPPLSGAAPTCSISYNPSSVAIGDPLQATWTAQNAKERYYGIYNANNVAVFGPIQTNTNGSLTDSPFSDLAPGTYVRKDTVKGAGGTGTCQASLVVTAPATSGAPTCTISYSPATIRHGVTLNAYWSVTNATSRSYSIKNAAGRVVYATTSSSLSGSISDAHVADDLGPGTYTRYDVVTGPNGTGTCQAPLKVEAVTSYDTQAPNIASMVASVAMAPYNTLVDMFTNLFVAMGVQ